MRDSSRYHKETFRASLSDTSCYGNVFYLSYHRWVVIAKENFFLENVEGFSALFRDEGIKLIVLESSLRIYKEIRLHDEIYVFVGCSSLKKLKAHLEYIFVDFEGKTIAEAANKIIFLNSNNKIIPIPGEVFRALSSIKEK
ncbi:MAG: acyl-CoA thioesterase [Candidatus Margulisiibacteriota bacterium]